MVIKYCIFKNYRLETTFGQYIDSNFVLFWNVDQVPKDLKEKTWEIWETLRNCQCLQQFSRVAKISPLKLKDLRTKLQEIAIIDKNSLGFATIFP